MTIIMDRDNLFGFVMGESLEHGLHTHSNYTPHSIKYYGGFGVNYRAHLREASQVSRGG